MTDAEALAVATARTGHPWAELVARDPPFWDTVRRIAASPVWPPSAPEPPLPGPWARAKNLTAAVAAHAAAGMPAADPETVAARRAVCDACPRFRPSDARCSVCSCYVATKAAWLEQRCPENRWPA